MIYVKISYDSGSFKAEFIPDPLRNGGQYHKIIYNEDDTLGDVIHDVLEQVDLSEDSIQLNIMKHKE